eukprot:SAG31_NODE_23936_length_492_cov_1.318066_1_plen_56_part_10
MRTPAAVGHLESPLGAAHPLGGAGARGQLQLASRPPRRQQAPAGAVAGDAASAGGC